MDDETLYSMAFSHCLTIGPVRFSHLRKKYGNAKEAYFARGVELIRLIGAGPASRFCSFRRNFDPEKTGRLILEKGIKVLCARSREYPAPLLHIDDPPICLYMKGGLQNGPVPAASVAIVGSRKPTPYGLLVANRFAAELGERGITVVSGMAAGIDTAAHRGALRSGGYTVAVLGCGIDVVYPASNGSLYREIAGRGAILSEFPPGTRPRRDFFIMRNRLISGLSLGVIVVEGACNSGSLITARYAASQGKEVFAPPVPLTSYLSEAPSILLKQGAVLATCISDVLEGLGMKDETITKTGPALTSGEEQVVRVLSSRPLTADELARETGEAVNVLSGTLSLLELKGVVQKNSEGKYEMPSGV